MSSRKVVVTAQDGDLEAKISPDFGRCQFFLIVEVAEDDIKDFQATPNEPLEGLEGGMTGGAGTAALRIIKEERVSEVITSNIGRRPLRLLRNAGGVEVHRAEEGTARENVENLLAGNLDPF